MSPPEFSQAVDICRLAEPAIRESRGVVIHCRGGLGRTGTMLGAVLTWFGDDPATAVAKVRAAERYAIQTQAQLRFVHEFADRIFGWHPRVIQHRSTSCHLKKPLLPPRPTFPNGVAAGYVDMVSGMLLGVKTVDSHPSQVLDLVAATTGDLFQGKNVVAIEQLFNKSRGLPVNGAHYFNEIVVFSTNLLHVFIRSKKNPDHAAVFVSRIAANVGMTLVKARGAMASVEAAI